MRGLTAHTKLKKLLYNMFPAYTGIKQKEKKKKDIQKKKKDIHKFLFILNLWMSYYFFSS